MRKSYKRKVTHCVWVCPQPAQIIYHYRQLPAISYLYTIIQMSLRQKPQFIKNLPEVNLKQATKEDVAVVAHIGAASFGSNYEDVLERMSANLLAPNCQVWLASVKDKLVGKIHFEFQEDKIVYVHDLCILPSYRKQYFATAMLLSIIKKLNWFTGRYASEMHIRPP